MIESPHIVETPPQFAAVVRLSITRARMREAMPPAKQLALEFLVSLRSIAIFSTVGLVTFMLERAGLKAGDDELSVFCGSTERSPPQPGVVRWPWMNRRRQ